jgi:cell division inhibitor SulA
MARADSQALPQFPPPILQAPLHDALQEEAQEATQEGLQKVLRNPAIWRARQLAQARAQNPDQVLPTGFAALDAALPDAGWPLGSLTELLIDNSGVGELSLLLPALRNVCAQGRGVALLAPPWLPNARAWENAKLPLPRLLLIEASGNDLLWSAEQVLRSGECGAVVLWGPAAGRALDHRALQRLQLAAVTGNACCFLYRPCSAAANPSPAPLRLQLSARDDRLQLHCIKQRGALRLPSSRPLALRTRAV